MFIVTEYCEGKELFDVILDRHFLPEEEACYIFYDLLSTVRAMHANRIMHRLTSCNLEISNHKMLCMTRKERTSKL